MAKEIDVGDIILNSIYAVGSLVVVALAGFILAKMGVLTKVNRKILSECNFYVIGAVFALVEVMNVIDRKNLNEVGYLVFGSISNIVIGFVVCIAVVYCFGLDIRLRFSFTFMCVYANIVIFPDMLSKATCTSGFNVGNKNCPKQKSYASISLIYITCLYWITIYPILKYERLTRLKTMKVFAVALHFYESLEKFLNDKGLSNYTLPIFPDTAPAKAENKNVDAISPNEIKAEVISTPANVHATSTALVDPSPHPQSDTHEFPRLKPIVTTDALFEIENANIDIGSHARYNFILEHYAKFEKEVLSKPECAKIMETITKSVLEPAKLDKIEENVAVFSWEFVKTRILGSPPASFAILGLILGFIFPFKEWVFGTTAPMPLLITTLRSIGSMYSTISMILLGTTIAEGAVITRDMIIGWKHVIMTNLIRNLILPLLGLFWVFIVIRSMDETLFNKNGVLMLIDYIYWIAPNGIGLVTIYIMAQYPAKEFGVMSIYMNLVSIPMMTVHLIIYSYIYVSLKA